MNQPQSTNEELIISKAFTLNCQNDYEINSSSIIYKGLLWTAIIYIKGINYSFF